MLLFHGSRTIVESPEIRIQKYNKDFFFGFYCTMLEEQAKRWAVRYNGKGYVSKFLYVPDDSLAIKIFPEMSEEWLDFVIACRLGHSHSYDIVEGPMADDTIFNYIHDYISGRISRAAFWELARFRYPTHQISFHTARALLTLTFKEGVEVVDKTG